MLTPFNFFKDILTPLSHQEQVRTALYTEQQVLPMWLKDNPVDLRVEKGFDAAWAWLQAPNASRVMECSQASNVVYAAVDAYAENNTRRHAYIAQCASYAAFAAVIDERAAHHAAQASAYAVYAQHAACRPITVQAGQLISMRGVSMHDRCDSQPLGPVFLLLHMDVHSCELLDPQGEKWLVEKQSLHCMHAVV